MRNPLLDDIRGFLIFIMMMDHFGGSITKLTSQSLGFVSAAEGFIFFSGVTIGLVYNLDKYSPGTLFSKVRKRLFCIYHYHVIAFLSLLPLLIAFPAYFSKELTFVEPFFNQPLYGVFLYASLIFQPYFFDTLPLYIFLLLLYLCYIKWFSRVSTFKFVGFSFFIYVVAFFLNPIEYLGVHSGFSGGKHGPFNILSWQFPFFLGVLVGNEKIVVRRIMSLAVVAGLIVGCFFLLRHGIWPSSQEFYAGMMGRKNILPLRLFNFFAVVYLSYCCKPCLRLLKVFRPIGKKSLVVFTVHVVVLYLVGPFLGGLENLHLRTLWSLGLFLLFYGVFNSAVYEKTVKAVDLIKAALFQVIRKVSWGRLTCLPIFLSLWLYG